MSALPPLLAYRADTAAAPDSQMLDDPEWLMCATQVVRAARLPDAQQRGPLSDVLRRMGEEESARDPDPARLRLAASLAAVRAATAMEDAARFHLAFATLSSVLLLLPESEVVLRGRVLAQQGRIARQLGEIAEARARYDAVEALAREQESSELLARAWIGYGILAQVRGNYPEVRSWFGKVLTLGDAPESLRRMAHKALIVAASSARDFDSAALHAWAALQSATADEEAEALVFVAEVFLQAGHARVALKGFGAALLRPLVPRHELPALGGAAVAAARGLPAHRAKPLVERFASRIQAIIASYPIPYAIASALADIGDAYAALGAQEAASKVRAQAKLVAEQHRFHEMVLRLEQSQSAAALRPVANLRAGAAVAAAVESFETPDDVARALAEV